MKFQCAATGREIVPGRDAYFAFGVDFHQAAVGVPLAADAVDERIYVLADQIGAAGPALSALASRVQAPYVAAVRQREADEAARLAAIEGSDEEGLPS